MGELLSFRPRTVADLPTTASVPTPAPTPEDHPRPTARGPEPEPLWREIAGSVLRAARQQRQQTLAEVAKRAGISVQYLSEVERGRKEPSSEVLAAITGALELELLDLTAGVARRLSLPRRPEPSRPFGPVALAV